MPHSKCLTNASYHFLLLPFKKGLLVNGQFCDMKTRNLIEMIVSATIIEDLLCATFLTRLVSISLGHFCIVIPIL